jgi:hypothetical protein
MRATTAGMEKCKRENQCRREEDAKGPDRKVDILRLIGHGPQGIKTRSGRKFQARQGSALQSPRSWRLAVEQERREVLGIEGMSHTTEHLSAVRGVALKRVRKGVIGDEKEPCVAARFPNPTCDHSRSQISVAPRPCRKAIRISVAPRRPYRPA